MLFTLALIITLVAIQIHGIKTNANIQNMFYQDLSGKDLATAKKFAVPLTVGGYGLLFVIVDLMMWYHLALDLALISGIVSLVLVSRGILSAKPGRMILQGSMALGLISPMFI